MALEVETWWYVVLSASMFAIGAWGIMTRKNAIMILMSVEIMLNAANINLVAFSSTFGTQDGFIFAFFSIAIAAAEAAVGLAIFINLFRVTGSVDVSNVNALKG